MARFPIADCRLKEYGVWIGETFTVDLLHKSNKGEAFAPKNPDFPNKSGRKC